MKFFFDHNLPPQLAHAINKLSVAEPAIKDVIALVDRFPRDVKDDLWITELGQEGGWIVITQDNRITLRSPEREALRKAGLITFVLAKSWASQPLWIKASNLVRWWPNIIEQALRIQGGATFRVPWRLQGKGKFEQVKL